MCGGKCTTRIRVPLSLCSGPPRTAKSSFVELSTGNCLVCHGTCVVFPAMNQPCWLRTRWAATHPELGRLARLLQHLCVCDLAFELEDGVTLSGVSSNVSRGWAELRGHVVYRGRCCSILPRCKCRGWTELEQTHIKGVRTRHSGHGGGQAAI